MRRDALIAAAADSFADRGYSVPLEEVAARAGVGRGTLYRNFRDREALAIAIFAREIDRIDAIVAEAGERPFRDVMVDLALTGTRATALFARIATELVADTADRAALEALGQRLATALEPLASRARTDGDLRAGIDGATLGLALRMVGENPHAAESQGLSVAATRTAAIVAGSALMGVAGAFLTLSAFNAFFFNMINGRGWICVALVVFASWRPGKALLGALLFAFFDALQLRLQQSGDAALPYQLYLMLPYALSIVALVLVARKASYPQALMKPYRQGER